MAALDVFLRTVAELRLDYCKTHVCGVLNYVHVHVFFSSSGPITDYGSGTAVEQISDNNDDNMDQVHVHVPPTATTNFDDQEPNQSFTDREIKLIQKRINLF